MTTEDADEKPSIGEVIDGKYIVDAILGVGGMGVVVRAHHEVTANTVAIKLLLKSAALNQDLAARFKREASAPNKIGHPGFVKTIDYGHYKDKPYLVMEFLSGSNLGEEIRRNGPMPITRAANILRQIAEALAAAHKAGIVHRDVKAENVFLLPGDVVKILDLGIAKFLTETDGAKTRTFMVMGTPQTMSPEQCRGSNIDHRSDIYALACVAFYVVAERWPFESANFGDITAGHMRDEPPRLRAIVPSAPEAFSDLVYRNMAKDPNDRLQSMSEFADALGRFLTRADAVTEIRPGEHAPARSAAARPASRFRVLAAMIAVVVAGLAVGGYFVFARPREGTVKTQPEPEATRAPDLLAPAAASDEVFKLVIDVTPPDAELVVDGAKQKGQAPYFIESKAGRTLHVEARREGYHPTTQNVAMGATDQRLQLRLEPAEEASAAATQGRLEVFVEPWATVYVDGKKLGQTPRRGEMLPVGTHVVKLINGEHGHPPTRPYEKRVTIRPGKTETIDLNWSDEH